MVLQHGQPVGNACVAWVNVGNIDCVRTVLVCVPRRTSLRKSYHAGKLLSLDTRVRQPPPNPQRPAGGCPRDFGHLSHFGGGAEFLLSGGSPLILTAILAHQGASCIGQAQAVGFLKLLWLPASPS